MVSPLLAALVLAAPVYSAPSGVPRAQCFPLETLPLEDRLLAEEMLLKLLDSEALYTVVGGLKPMSSGWYTTRVVTATPEIAPVERARRIVATFRCGDEIVASIQPFLRVYEGKRYLEGVVFHRAATRRTIAANPALFGAFGVTPSSEPIAAVLGLDGDETPERNRAYGVLFGYPPRAVDFFVKAEESRRAGGEFVVRDFLSIPVFGAETNRFVYAVPKGAARLPEDDALREAAAPILALYRKMRPRYVGPGKAGAARLVRDLLDDGRGRCSPEAGLAKARRGAGRKG